MYRFTPHLCIDGSHLTGYWEVAHAGKTLETFAFNETPVATARALFNWAQSALGEGPIEVVYGDGVVLTMFGEHDWTVCRRVSVVAT